MAIIFPDPSLQTPVNTFSPTSSPDATTNGLTYTWDGALGVWTSAAGGGGGGGVASIGVTAPITDTGTATAPVIGIAAATTAAPGSVQLATAAEAATGTNALKAMTPATGVPKTPADMTGALYLPGGNDAARPAAATGLLRYNNQAGLPAVMEFYNGSAWVTVSTGGAPLNNVIYGVITTPATWTGAVTINHAAVDLAKSYIIISGGINTDGGGGVAPYSQAFISARTSTSFAYRFNNSASNGQQLSYFIIY